MELREWTDFLSESEQTSMSVISTASLLHYETRLRNYNSRSYNVYGLGKPFKDRWAKEETAVNVGDVDESRVWIIIRAGWLWWTERPLSKVYG